MGSVRPLRRREDNFLGGRIKACSRFGTELQRAGKGTKSGMRESRDRSETALSDGGFGGKF